MTRRQGYGIALVRIVLGVIFVMHGYLGLAIIGPAGVAQYAIRTGVPADVAPVVAWYMIVAHLAGGALLIIGLWTVLAALVQVPIMAAAVFLIHLPQGFFMRGIVTDAAAGRAIAGGYEFTLLVLAATLAVALTGPGALSVDDTRRHRPRKFQMP